MAISGNIIETLLLWFYVLDRMTVVACFVGGQHYKSIPKYDSLPPLVANLAIQAISINSAYTSRILVRRLQWSTD